MQIGVSFSHELHHPLLFYVIFLKKRLYFDTRSIYLSMFTPL